MATLDTRDTLETAVLNRLADIQRQMTRTAQLRSIDEQELREREEAARAYAVEDEDHLVAYAKECVTTSRNAMTDVRKVQYQCWEVYQESEPPTYADKEEWQSRVVIPKPHSAVQFAKTQVRKAFNPQFLSIENDPHPLAGQFWHDIMIRMLDETHANMRMHFPDATEMALAIGISMEMIPLWDERRGLQISLVEPWKIHRDPDALSRDPQSGMYWIHEEYQDLWTLKQNPYYVNVEGIEASLTPMHNPENPEMNAEREAERKRMLVTRNQFRKMVLVREFWGVILDRRGDLLLPHHTYTIAGNKVIKPPERSPYKSLRWPGISFSAIPHLLRYDGRGIVQGIRSLWYWMCALMALHSDNLNWIVNPMIEINQQGLIDQHDTDIIPGRPWFTKDTISGQQVVRTVDRRFITNEILANLQYASQAFEEGTFVTSTVKGLPGYRNEITFREVAQQLDQSRDMFATLGENIEAGALDFIRAAMETCQLNMTMQDVQNLLPGRKVNEYLQEIAASGAPMEDSPMGIPLPLLSGHFSVSGLTSVLKDAEVIQSMERLWLPLSDRPQYAPYIKPYHLLKSLERRSGVRDEDVLVSEQEAEAIAQAQQQAGQQAQQLQQQLLEAQMAAEQQRLQLEGEKQQLEAAKLALEAQQMQLDAQLQAEETAVEVERLEAERQQVAQDLRRQEADIQKISVEIARTILQAEAIREKLRLDHERLALQQRQAAAQLSLQAGQLALQAQTQRQQARNGQEKS